MYLKIGLSSLLQYMRLLIRFIFAFLMTFQIALQDASAAPTAAECADPNSYYQVKCARCHGTYGKGDGNDSAGLPGGIQPRDFTIGRFKSGQCSKKLEAVVKYGGAAMGLSSAMPPFNGDECGGSPISDATITAVINLVLEMSTAQ